MQEKTRSGETKQTSELDWDLTQTLEGSVLQEEMSNASAEM